MKKTSLYGLLTAVLILSGCHKDNDVPAPFDEETYEGRTELSLTYNGSAISGKSVKVTPASSDAAKVSFFSEIDLGDLSEKLDDIPDIAGPGVLPGSPMLSIDVPVGVDGTCHTFSHSGETDYLTYSVSAKFTDEVMECAFTDVKLKDLSFAGGTWKPMPADNNPLSDRQPFHIVWETKLPVQIPGLGNGIQDALRILVNTPFIPVYNNTASMSLTQVIANGLRTLGMTADGLLPVTYLQTANGASVFTQVPFGTFQYVPLSQNAIKFYANPTDLLSLILLNNTNRDPNIPDNPFGKRQRSDAGMLYAQLIQIFKTLAPMLSQGMPMACVRTGDTMMLYADTQVLLPLLKNTIVPLLANPAMRGIVEDFITNNDKLAPYAVALMAAYDALPLILDQTTKLELGLNFVKA